MLFADWIGNHILPNFELLKFEFCPPEAENINFSNLDQITLKKVCIEICVYDFVLKLTSYMRHLTCDTLHVTPDTQGEKKHSKFGDSPLNWSTALKGGGGGGWFAKQGNIS